MHNNNFETLISRHWIRAPIDSICKQNSDCACLTMHGSFRPSDESAYLKISFLISVVSTQKNRLIETVLLRTQNICFN